MVETGERKRREKDKRQNERMDQIKRLEKIGEREKKKKKSMKNNGKVRYSLVPPRVVSIGNCRSRNANFTRARVKLPSTHYAHEIAVVFIAARRFVSARCQMKNNFATLQTFYVPVNTHPFHDSARFLFFSYTKTILFCFQSFHDSAISSNGCK